MRNIAAGANPIIVRKGMKKATDCVVENLKAMSSPVTGKEHIARIASISSESEEVDQLVADAIEKVKAPLYGHRRKEMIEKQKLQERLAKMISEGYKKRIRECFKCGCYFADDRSRGIHQGCEETDGKSGIH